METSELQETSNKSGYLKLIVTGVISLAVGVGSALLVDMFRSTKPRLEYAIVTSSVFAGPSQNIAILSIEVTNLGRKEVEDLSVTISWDNAQYKESKLVGLPASKYHEVTTIGAYNLEAPFINPNEKIKADLLLTLSDVTLKEPRVDVRAKGVVGTPAPKPGEGSGNLLSTTFAGAVSLLTAVMAMWTMWRMKWGSEKSPLSNFLVSGTNTGDAADQRDVVASLLEIQGLHADASRIRELHRRITYWSIVDGLTQELLERDDPKGQRALATVLEELLNYVFVEKGTAALIRFNVARLYFELGQEPDAKARLEQAYVDNPLVAKRIAMCPDLAELIKNSKVITARRVK